MNLINASRCRRFLLQFAKDNRTHKFTRVSKETLEAMEAQLRSHLVSHVQRFPSKGKTL